MDNLTEQEHEALLQFLYMAPIGLVQADVDGAVLMANPLCAQLLMPLAPNGDLSNLFAVLAPLAPELPALVAALPEPGSVVCDGLRLALPAAPGRPATTLALNLLRLDGQRLMGSLSDISHTVREEQQRLARQLHEQGRTDALTGLPNRGVAREAIARAMAAAPARPVAVLLVDVDRFDQINLAHGRAAGDAVLRQLSTRLAALAGSDAAGWTAARLGGDVFVLVGGAGADAAQLLAQRLVELLARPYATDDGRPLHLTVSVGIRLGQATDGGDGTDADALLQDAGIALREARHAGAVRHALFDPAMKARATHRAMVEADLRLALDRGDQLHLVYQPIVGLAAGAGELDTVGVEALVRWRHPQRGNVPPLAFIEIAEQTGLIGPLGAFVLQTACRQFMRWRAELGPLAPQRLSVNLSRAQLGGARLLAEVRAALADTGMPPSALQLEVTESLAAQDDGVRDQLQALKALGLSLALDDFGTGYSSLSSLHQLPVDLVKIDRSFVSQLETSAHHRALVKATVDVARSLGMGTVAEGIETPGQAALLQSLQCQKGQGYWFGRPMDAAALAPWLRERRAAPPAQGFSPPPPASAPAAASRSASGSAA